MIDLSTIKKVPVSFYVAQFDEVCEAAYARDLHEGPMKEAIVNYQVITDNRGHLYFTKTNNYTGKLLADMEIGVLEAQALKASAKDFIRRTGGYINFASDNYGLDEGRVGALTATALTMAGAMALLL